MTWNSDVIKNVIIENGSTLTRVGFAGDSTPRFCFSTNQPLISPNIPINNVNAFLPQPMNKSNVVENGIIVNWDGITQNWDYIFNSLLHVDSTKCSVLLVNRSLDPWLNQKKIAEIMFEHFKVPALLLKSGSELIFQQFGKDTGLILNFDCNFLEFVPILEKQVMPHLVKRIELGDDLNSSQKISLGLVEQIYDAIMQIELILHGGIEFRKLCVQNIILAGELPQIADFAKSLQNSLIQQDSNKGSLRNLEFQVRFASDPKNAAWIAGAEFALTSDFSNTWVTLQQYQEKGPSVIPQRL